MKTMKELRREHPAMITPMECENGCGKVIELADAFRSYKDNEQGECLLVCECCAAEEGHRDEQFELPEDAPKCCARKPK